MGLKNYSTNRIIIYVSIIASFFVSIFVYFYNASYIDNRTINDLIPNLVIELLSIIIIIFFIERINSIEKEKEREHLEKLALKQIKRPLQNFIKVFIKLIIVSNPKNRLKNCDSIDDCFDKTVLIEIKHFNLNGVWPKPNEKCSEFLSETISIFENKINALIGKYAPYLTVSFLESLENILMNEFLDKLRENNDNFSEKDILEYYSELRESIDKYNHILKGSSIDGAVDYWNNNVKYAGKCRKQGS